MRFDIGKPGRGLALAAVAAALLPVVAVARDDGGVKVHSRSIFRNLVPADAVEKSALAQYNQMTRQAFQQGKLLDEKHPTTIRIRRIAKDLLPHTPKFNDRAPEWDWEVNVPELQTSVFIIPGPRVKNGEERLVVLNRIAASVIESRRGLHRTHVFGFKGRPVRRMLNTAWKKARIRAGLPDLRVHDLKHTFGRRLRAAGISFEDRQDLLGHRSGRITTHYSAAELTHLIDAAERVCDRNGSRPELVVLRGKVGTESRKTPARHTVCSGPKS